ncbi:hypothetical protein E3N88_43296 [Mikania micrantha]|uniref:Hyaluronan/mRNA-binding protein domain-containing protein n=1 Tax=Mikania micrantha TaxID=192012 RepID=A0A5N6LFG2_9ASTR|nr:hypothetical protein E3N88_43296 [Mikania micrantha]
MATMNPFDLLGDDDNDDLSQLVQKIAAAPAKKAPRLLPLVKPLHRRLSFRPSLSLQLRPLLYVDIRIGDQDCQVVLTWLIKLQIHSFVFALSNSADNEGSFGNHAVSVGQGGGTEESNGRYSERRGGYGGPRGGFRGGRQGSFGNGDVVDGERPRRTYDRHSGTGHGNEFKREGAGRGNWGTQADEINHEVQEAVNEGEKIVASEKPGLEEEAADVKKENSSPEHVEEPENKEMTLEEYQKVLDEKRKAFEAFKTEERKVEVDKDLASMQQLPNKKTSDDIFVKLVSDKDKHKEIIEKEERAKKSLSINEFLKPAEGERHYTPGGRGRGRGGSRGGGRFNQGGGSSYVPEAPKIEDPGHFPTLGGK